MGSKDDGPLQVFIRKNEENSTPQPVEIQDLTFAKFKTLAGKKLKMKVKTVYLDNGVEITAMDDMKPGDQLYISAGEPFFKTHTAADIIHIAVLGAGHVGKSALTLRFVRDFFIKDWDPTIEDAYRKSTTVDGRPVQLEILDTAGQDDFESLRHQWMMDKQGYLFVFALDDAKSLQQVQPFYNMHTTLNEGKIVPIVLVGNKSDVVKADPSARKVSVEEAEAKAREYKAKYIETSALSCENVHEAVALLVRDIWGSQPKPTPKKSGWSFCTML